jgi:two-component system chemotaxis response regulator CheB
MKGKPMIRVLIVDDSPVAQEFLNFIFSDDPDIHVVGIANNGKEALELVERNKPDVVTMDIYMPGMDGFETTRKIMELYPLPIVIVSGSRDAEEVNIAFKAIEAGALTAVNRPPGLHHPEFEHHSKELVTTIKLMSEVKVVRRVPANKYSRNNNIKIPSTIDKTLLKPATIKAVVIGASTGGPLVIKKILSEIPQNFPVPILITQHISEGFVNGFADWLTNSTGFKVNVAHNGQILNYGSAYLAPDKCNLGVDSTGSKIVCTPFTNGKSISSISHLFQSAANAFKNNVIGVLLTGMGNDGAVELKLLKDLGAITIVQDKESSVVFGMPAEAIKLDAASLILPAEKISSAVVTLVNNESGNIYK